LYAALSCCSFVSEMYPVISLKLMPITVILVPL